MNAAPCSSLVEGKDGFRPRAPRLHGFQVDAVSSSLFQPVLTLLKRVELQAGRDSRLCSVDASVCVLENAMLSLSRAPSARVCAARNVAPGAEDVLGRELNTVGAGKTDLKLRPSQLASAFVYLYI